MNCRALLIAVAIWLLAFVTVPAAVQVALVSLDGTGLAMGAYCGMIEEAREWSAVGQDVELLCLAGPLAPVDLQAGIVSALESGADGIIIWPRAEDGPAVEGARAALAQMGVRLVVAAPWGHPDDAALLADGLPPDPAAGPLPCRDYREEAHAGLRAEVSQEGPPAFRRVWGSRPWLVPLLERGDVCVVFAEPAEDWGRATMRECLRALDPRMAEIFPVLEPPRIQRITRAEAPAFREDWTRWLAVEARDAVFRHGQAVP